MRYTNLELVQNILSSMDSDEVNSVSDTVESQQVLQVIKTVYYDILTRGGLTRSKTPFNLIASGDNTKPVLMTKPSSIVDIDWLKYNCVLAGDTDPHWREMQYLPIEDFMQFVHNLAPSDPTTGTMDLVVNGFNITFPFKNNTAPCYYTTLDDVQIVFDAYDSAVDNTLQSSKTMSFGLKDFVFIETDDFVPELPLDQFALLLNEAKSLAWAELKQSIHAKAEKTARGNWVHLSKTRQHVPSGKFYSGAHAKDLGPNFARKR